MPNTVTDWDNEYARLARVSSQLRANGASVSDSDFRALQSGCNRLDSQLNSLTLPSDELLRRRRLVKGLQNNPALQQQDDLIDELAGGVERLKMQSQMIGDEAKMHLGLLGDMEQNIESAREGLEGETRRAEEIHEGHSIWKLQMYVAGLSVLMVILLIAGLL
mmetsp:Transcript_35919/g.50882  ORF Transcript_35919/g.50882 Transcript_35919/m.50882 type:complete len:163 (+) Transcript_35919:35-523(+)